MPKSFQYYAWGLWFIAALFYAYEFALRLSLTVMVPELMASFSLTAAGLGMLSAMYFYAYAAMQIPVGYLLDRFGARIMLSFAAILVAIGCFLFVETSDFVLACIARLMIGAGSAFAFVGVLKLSAAWFPAAQFPFIIGMTNLLGVMGAIYGEAPLALLVESIGWRLSIFIAMFIGLILALLMFNILRDSPQSRLMESPNHTPPNLQFKSAFKYVLSCRRTWLVALYAGLMVVPIIAFIELWSIPFLKVKFGLSSAQAAWLNSLTFLGIAVGGPFHGMLSGWLRSRKPPMFLGAVFAAIFLSALLYLPDTLLTNLWEVGALMVLFGFSTSTMLLAFAVNKELNPPEISGLVIGFTNMVVMSLGIVFQHIVSQRLDVFWKTSAQATSNAVPSFTLEQYEQAFLILILCQIIAGLLVFAIKETACCQQS